MHFAPHWALVRVVSTALLWHGLVFVLDAGAEREGLARIRRLTAIGTVLPTLLVPRCCGGAVAWQGQWEHSQRVPSESAASHAELPWSGARCRPKWCRHVRPPPSAVSPGQLGGGHRCRCIREDNISSILCLRALMGSE